MTTPGAGDACGVRGNVARAVDLRQLVGWCCCLDDDTAPMGWKRPLLCGSYSGHRHRVGSQASAVISASGVKTSRQWNLFCSWLQITPCRLRTHRRSSPPNTTPGRRASRGTSTLLPVFLAGSQLAPLPPCGPRPRAQKMKEPSTRWGQSPAGWGCGGNTAVVGGGAESS